MPQPERLLPLLHRAAAAFRATPGRRGHVVYLTDAADVCVVGDLHGNVENFSRVLKMANLGNLPRRHLVLQEVIHGKFRYPLPCPGPGQSSPPFPALGAADGGDKSHQLLDLIAALTCQFPGRVHFLPGNHELSQWTNRLIGKGGEDLNAIFRQGVMTAYKGHADAIYEAYMQLIAAAPLVVRTPNRVFLSHTLPRVNQVDAFDPTVLEREEFRSEDLIPGGSVHALVWGRSTSEENTAAFLRKVDADWLITGHVPQEQGFDVPNSRQIILDGQGSPACYCLFPCDSPLSLEDLKNAIGTL